jgi:hypothetical protein
MKTRVLSLVSLGAVISFTPLAAAQKPDIQLRAAPLTIASLS